MSGALCRIPADVWLFPGSVWHLVCRYVGVCVLALVLCRAGVRAGVASNRVSCVCYDLVSCVCYDSVRMYVIMYDMIRYVRNTIRSDMTGLCALCGIITYEYVYDMTLTRANMRHVALCYNVERGDTRSVYSNAYSISYKTNTKCI